jgi:hypothetical protein
MAGSGFCCAAGDDDGDDDGGNSGGGGGCCAKLEEAILSGLLLTDPRSDVACGIAEIGVILSPPVTVAAVEGPPLLLPCNLLPLPVLS